MLVVASYGGDFPSLQQALDYLERNPEADKRILVKPGVYKEQVTVRIPGVVITGESQKETEHTQITWAFGAGEIMPDGRKRGTFRSYTFMVDADEVILRNLTIENAAGPGSVAGQGIALYADGDCLLVDSCRLLGWQDTLFTAPLPETEIEPGGFAGPKQSAPRHHRKQYYKNCYIEGEVDFIFGGATAYFEHCTLFSKDIGKAVNGYVTAPSTPRDAAYGYVMKDCVFTGNCPGETVYLGRPWREYAKVVLLHCDLGEHIKSEGWHDWGKKEAHKTSFFGEYGCTGAKSDTARRPLWSYRLSAAEAAKYRREAVLGGGEWSRR